MYWCTNWPLINDSFHKLCFFYFLLLSDNDNGNHTSSYEQVRNDHLFKIQLITAHLISSNHHTL